MQPEKIAAIVMRSLCRLGQKGTAYQVTLPRFNTLLIPLIWPSPVSYACKNAYPDLSHDLDLLVHLLSAAQSMHVEHGEPQGSRWHIHDAPREVPCFLYSCQQAQSIGRVRLLHSPHDVRKGRTPLHAAFLVRLEKSQLAQACKQHSRDTESRPKHNSAVLLAIW